MDLQDFLIVVVAMSLSALSIMIYKIIKNFVNKKLYDKAVKRVKQVDKFAKEGKAVCTLINSTADPERIKVADDNSGILIDDTLYTDRNSYIYEENGTIYIIGKKEDYLVTIVGDFTDTIIEKADKRFRN